MLTATRVVNLTLPISPYFPVGATFPWESPYVTEDIATIERNGAHLSAISMGSGTGTRLRAPAFAHSGARTIGAADLDALVNRSARVLQVPKEAGEPIDDPDIEAAIARSGVRRGEAILVATGWGEANRWDELGERYALESPYFTASAAALLHDAMQQNGCNLLLTDCAHLDPAGGTYARREWAQAQPWLRPPYPSEQAKIYLRHYSREKARADWAASIALTRDAWVVAGLANCASLPDASVQLTVLPMFVQDAGEAPCTVVAETAG